MNTSTTISNHEENWTTGIFPFDPQHRLNRLRKPTSAFQGQPALQDCFNQSRKYPMKTVQYRSRAFSLVEVSASLAVIAFAFIGTLGLMANGVEQFRGAIDTTVTAQIAQRVLNDAQQTEFSSLIDATNLGSQRDDPEFTFRAPKIAEPALRYFDEQGVEIVPTAEAGLTAPERAKVVYQVNVRVRPRAEVPREAIEQGPQLAQVTVQIARQAGAAALAINHADGPEQNLFKLPPGIPVVTYSSLVGRNE